MQVKEFTLKYKRPDKFKLHLFGDLHLGTVHCAEAEIIKQRNEIRDDPYAIWVGMGDMSECITSHDKRWDPSQRTIPDWLEQDNIEHDLRKKVVSILQPISDKCVGMLFGNHEDSFRKQTNNNIHKNICEDLGVDNLGYSCFIHFIFKRNNSNEAHLIKGHFTHGAGGARTESGKINYLVNIMKVFNANIYGYAHTHSMQVYSPEKLGTSESLKIMSKGQIGALTGCWFRTYTQGDIASYGEMKAYAPTRIGCPVFILNIDKGTIEAITPPIEY